MGWYELTRLYMHFSAGSLEFKRFVEEILAHYHFLYTCLISAFLMGCCTMKIPVISGIVMD